MSLITELDALVGVLNAETRTCSVWAFYYRQWGCLDLAHEADGKSKGCSMAAQELRGILRRQEERVKGKEGE